uniref:Uncharacterized protein n=1 Tax=Lutzomyia longipalpis TaxID=7200 RepID=A0A1B0GJB2_LUTLO
MEVTPRVRTPTPLLHTKFWRWRYVTGVFLSLPSTSTISSYSLLCTSGCRDMAYRANVIADVVVS